MLESYLTVYLVFLLSLSLQLLRPSPCSICPASLRIRAGYLLFILTPATSLHSHPLTPPPSTRHAADARKCHFNSLHCARVLSLSLSLSTWVYVCGRVRLSLKHAEGMVHVYINSLCCRYCPSL